MDIDNAQSAIPSRSDTDTQKAKTLLERIVAASSNEGFGADFNGGSGTTAYVAENLAAAGSLTDLGKPACMIMRKRLIDLRRKPFCTRRLATTRSRLQRPRWAGTSALATCRTSCSRSYGRCPAAGCEPAAQPGPDCGIGFGGRGSMTLVLADSPNKLHRHGHLKGDRSARQPVGRLGPRGGAGLEL